MRRLVIPALLSIFLFGALPLTAGASPGGISSVGSAGPTMTSTWLTNPANNQRVATALFKQHYDNVPAIYYMTHAGDTYVYKMAGCESCSDAGDGIVLADAFQNPNPSDAAIQKRADATFGVYVNALAQRANSDIKLEAEGKLPNYIPSNEIIIHWKRRLAVTVAGIFVLIGSAIFLGWAVMEVRRQGTGLQWTA